MTINKITEHLWKSLSKVVVRMEGRMLLRIFYFRRTSARITSDCGPPGATISIPTLEIIMKQFKPMSINEIQ